MTEYRYYLQISKEKGEDWRGLTAIELDISLVKDEQYEVIGKAIVKMFKQLNNKE